MVFIDANLYKLHLITLFDLQANFFQDLINLLVKYGPAVLCWKHEVVKQDCDVMAFVDVLAHPPILRRKRRGTYPLAIRAPGTHLPGVIKAGTYYTRQGREFWYVTAQRFLSFELHQEPYQKIVLTTEHNQAWADRLTQAKAHLAGGTL